MAHKSTPTFVFNTVDTSLIARFCRPCAWSLLTWICLPSLVTADVTEQRKPPGPAIEEDSGGIFAKLDGWVTYSAGGAFTTDGSDSAMRRRLQRPDGFFGGIDELTFRGYVTGLWAIKGQARALPGIEDYELAFKINHPDGRYLIFNYDRYRTFYNGTGGYLPVVESFYSLLDSDLHVDRQFFTLELGHAALDFGDLYFRYTYSDRKGEKDSTIWGDVSVLGLGSRGVVPSLLDLDEERHGLEFGVVIEGERTTAEGRLFYEHSKYDNATLTERDDGNRKITQEEDMESDLFSAVATARHEFNEDILMTTAATYSEMNSSVSGNRIFGSDFGVPFDPLFLNYGSRDAAFLDLASASDWSQYTYNLNFLLTPSNKLTVVPSLRLEKVVQDANTAYKGVQLYRRDFDGRTEDEFGRIEGELEMRYRASPKAFLYTRGIFALESGDMNEFLRAEELQPLSRRGTALDYTADYDRRTLQFVAGGDFKLLQRLNVNVQGYVKEQLNEYDVLRDRKNIDEDGRNFTVIPRGEYPGYIRLHRRQTWGTNARLTWRPKVNLSSVTRVDYQWIPTYTSEFGGGQIGSADGRYLAITEAVTWTIKSWLPLQLHGGYVMNEVNTPANSFVSSSGANQEVLASENGYWHAGIQTSFQFDDKSWLEIGYDSYRSNNFHDNSVYSVPYGSALEEHIARIRYATWLRDNIQWSLDVAAVQSNDITSGSNNDFSSYVLSTGLRCKY